DTREERNILIENVYPKLKAYCKEAHGLEFQVVDMRWGVPEEASDDHAISGLCIQEICNCQKLSTGPNFVAFLNQRHGYRPLQPIIPGNEFGMLIAALEDADEDVSSLRTWYREDTNASPAIFVLQPISSIIPEYKNKTRDSKDQWQNVYNELHWKLKVASQKCHEKGQINEDQKHKYFMSVTEEEILHGILQAPGSAPDHCLCFVRMIDDIEEHLDHRLAWRFIDKDGDKVDTEAQKILQSLREEKVPYKLNKKVQKLSVKWNEKTGINKEEHSPYLQKFADLFFTEIKSMLDKAVLDEKKLTKDELFFEVLQHSTMAKERCEMFHGRDAVLDQVMAYIKGDAQQPYTVFGPSGSGKTSIMAKVARQVHLIHNRDAIVILRFLGTSPESSNVVNLLRSLCQQILINTGDKTDYDMDSLESLMQVFKTIVEKYDSGLPMVIFLDSLDQLSNVHSAHKLRWLPKKLGKNVKLIVSTYTDSKEIITRLKSHFPTANFCMVPSLGEELSIHILMSWLRSRDRCLTDGQTQLVKKAFSLCSLPLYLKLAFDQVVKWKSYTEISNEDIAHDVKHAIEMLFKSLEQKHGVMFVTRAFSYLTASRNGLSELELEDIMSLDDELLTDVFKYHVPPVRRVPGLLWARLRFDINSYLVDKEIDETRVSFWYHRQFYEAAEARYLSDRKYALLIHSHLADYYLGTWYNQPKPFKYTEHQAKKLDLQSLDSSADRKVSAQPLFFKHVDEKATTIRYNKRKLNNLPVQLAKAGRVSELNRVCLFNYKFLRAKLHSCSVGPVLSDFRMAGYEGSLLQRIIKGSQNTLRKFPRSLAGEITGHLLPFLTDKKDTPEKSLVTQCMESSLKSEDPIPYVTCYSSPDEALQYMLQHRAIPYGNKLAALSKDSKYLLSLAENNLLLFWDLTTGEVENEMETYDPSVCKMNILECCMDKNFIYLATTYQQKANPVVFVDMGTCEIMRIIHLEKTYPGVLLTDWLKFGLADDKIFVLSQGASADVFCATDGKQIHDFQIKPDLMSISKDEKKVVFHIKGEKRIAVYKTDNFTKDAEFSIPELPMSFSLTESGSEMIVMYKDTKSCDFVNIESADGSPGQTLCHLEHSKYQSFKGLQTASNGHILLQIDDGFLLWNYGKNRFIHEFRVPAEVQHEHRVLEIFGHLTIDGTLFIMVFEWHLLVWNAKSGKLICVREISKAKIEILLVDNKDERVVTISKRQNSFSVWKISSLMESDSLFSPITLSSGPRYSAIPTETGQIALLRGNSAKEVVVIDLEVGKVKHKIAEGRNTYRPVLTDDGKYAILKEYTTENLLDNLFYVWNLDNGKVLYSIPGNSLEVKYWTYSNSKVAIYSEFDNKDAAEIAIWDLKNGKLINKLPFINKNKGDSVLLFDQNDENLLVSRYDRVLNSVATCEVIVMNAQSGEQLFTLKNIVPLSFQRLRPSDSLFCGIQFQDDKNFTIVFDSKLKRIINKGQLDRELIYQLSISQDGKFGLERSLKLFNLEKMTKLCQFDMEEEANMRKQSKNATTSPRLMASGKHAVWANLRTNLIKIGNVEKQEIQSVYPIHSVPLCMDVSALGLILIGCEDGRLMILQIPGSDVGKEEGTFRKFIENFRLRLKKTGAKFSHSSSDAQPATMDTFKKSKQNKSKVCALL
ncbi:hypothetical protein FSP39_024054, partial [Pinctada imbricata]